MKKKIVSIIAAISLCSLFLMGCEESPTSGSKADVARTVDAGNTLQENQPTPSDIEYSLERYNLIRRAYWVNGQREKANSLPCEVDKPLGYVVLFSNNVAVGNFVVDGKVSSLNSFLTPDSEYYERDMNASGIRDNKWLSDVDGSYGANDDGIFFFTTDGKYIEWSGDYLYSDIPFEVDDPVLKTEKE